MRSRRLAVAAALLAIALPIAAYGCRSKDPNDCIADLLTDPENCGACVHSCKGSACTNGFCDPVDLATQQADPSTLLLVDGNLVWADQGDTDANGAAVVRCPLDGCPSTGPTVLATPSRIQALAVGGSSIVWTDPRGAISSCALADCASPKVVGLFAAGLGSPPAPIGTLNAIVADDTSFFFTSVDPQAGVVASCPLAGCAPTSADATVIAGAQADVSALAMNADTVFWGSDGTIRSCARVGCTKPTDLVTDQTLIGAIVLEGTTLYWATGLATMPNRIRSMSTSGGTVTDIALAERAVGGVAVDGDYIYWTEPDGGTIKRAPKSGTGLAKVFVTGESEPSAILVNAGWVYWLNRGTDGLKFTNGALRRVVLPP